MPYNLNLQLQKSAQYFQKGLVLRILTELENPNSFQAKPVNIDSKEEYLVNRLIGS